MQRHVARDRHDKAVYMAVVVERGDNLYRDTACNKKDVITLPIKMPVQYKMVGEKKSSTIKNALFNTAEKFAANIPSASAIKRTTVDLVKRTASATKERAKARGVTAAEIATGGLVAKTAATAVAAAGATGIALTTVPWVAGFAAAALAGGIIKTVTDGEKTETDNS